MPATTILYAIYVLFVLVSFGLSVWAIYNAAQHKRAGWAVAILLLGGIGAILYLIFGGKKKNKR
jgi:hypothetical protein